MSGNEKKVSQWVTEAGKDGRFSKVLENPLYRRVPKKEKRVTIDKRFESMFHDDKFKLRYHMDKRGKPMNTTTTENLQRLYNVDVDGEEDSNKEAESVEKDSLTGTEKGLDESIKEDGVDNHFEKPDVSKKTQIGLTEAEKKKLRSAEIDYTRGEGLFVSEESEDSSSDEDDATDNVMHEWGELDRDAPTTEEATYRLALCNMDWDRLNATDLMVLFSSFVPAGGCLKIVTIYPSEFGKKRLEEEELHGPKELLTADGDTDEETYTDENSGEEDEEGSRFNMEKLRQYQLNRLKYYYAVLEFDSVTSADKVYTECDGMEYESSATKIDLRFIPDDMTFDEEPKDVCDTAPDGKKYVPRFFTTTALQQAKVDLTWDETDPRRKELTEKMFNPKENVDDEDIKAYLASSESDTEEEDQVEGEQPTSGGKDEDAISKYKALLSSIEDTERKKKNKDVEMEITWGLGLKSKTEKLVQQKMEEEKAKKLTPWEEMLAKRREKRKNRKSSKKEDPVVDKVDEDKDDEQPFSDDDVDIDMNDPFFKEAFNDDDSIPKLKSAKKQKGNKQESDADDAQDDSKRKELELLLMDEEPDTRRHFSLKKLMNAESAETATGKKKKKLKKKMKNKELSGVAAPEDDFSVNLKDDRFAALYSSHQFNIDPSDPNFKKTKAMEAIIMEKHKRRIDTPRASEMELKKTKTEESTSVKSSIADVPKKMDKADVAFLVQSLKGRAKSWLPVKK